MDVSPPPQGDDPIITQFRPIEGQWELNDKTITRIDPETGQSILHNYCDHINATPLAVYRYLIEVKGCDINAQDKYNNIPLHYAIYRFNPRYSCDINVLAYLINLMDVNVNIKDLYGRTFLHKACERVNELPVDVFKLLIETHGGDVNAQANNKNTPLHNALHDFDPNRLGDVNVLIYLLSQKGINVNIKGQDDYTLLHWACYYFNILPLDVFKLLIETHGADVNVQNDDNDTPLYLGLREFNPRNGGDISVLQYLFNQTKVDANIKGQRGYTILHRACININTLPLEIFKVLIETHGADVNVQDSDKNTPIHCALFYFDPRNGGGIHVLNYLLTQKGINVNTKGYNGNTFLHAACVNINALPIEIFKLLIETMGCDVNAQTNDKDTPIHRALGCFDPCNGDISVLMYLLSQEGVNGDTKGKDGRTFLHKACQNINNLPLDVFKLLIETMGCGVNVRDSDNDTPIHNALRCFDPNDDDHLVPVLMYLVDQKGINPNIKDKNGHTLLHLACICKIGDDGDDHDENDHYDYDDYDYDHEDSPDESSEDSVIQNQEADTNLSEIVEIIAERCVQQVLDETYLK
jgi:ankyrin repeat protein